MNTTLISKKEKTILNRQLRSVAVVKYEDIRAHIIPLSVQDKMQDDVAPVTVLLCRRRPLGCNFIPCPPLDGLIDKPECEHKSTLPAYTASRIIKQLRNHLLTSRLGFIRSMASDAGAPSATSITYGLPWPRALSG